MHVVALAWLYIIGTVALTAGSMLAGALLFALVGVAPVAFLVALAVLRRRARLAAFRGSPASGVPLRDSVGEHGVREADHAEPRADQR